MNVKKVTVIIIATMSLLAMAATALASWNTPQEEDLASNTLIATVRESTEQYQDSETAMDAGYGLFHGCVSSATEGSMGIHLVNGELVGDGALDATRPEALLYQYRNGRLHLVGVEYVTIAEAWHANHEGPPMLAGQLFNYVGSPNRYGLPAFYELHVWAWKHNPLGTFTDFNPRVNCNQYFDGALSHISE